MSARNVATIAAKDLRITITKRSARLSLVIFPLVIAIGPPLLARFTGAGHQGVPAVLLPRVLDAFTFYFVIIAALLPTAIASYSLVGEKIERSLEPLLATRSLTARCWRARAWLRSCPRSPLCGRRPCFSWPCATS
jgi:ABC-2 type transport system permease protein